MADEKELEIKSIDLPKKKTKTPSSPIEHLQEKTSKPKKKPKEPKEEEIKEKPQKKPKTADSKPKEAVKKTKTTEAKTLPEKPKTSDMVNQALQDLRTRKGTSLYAIKKYMADKYNIDPDKTAFFIKRYLRTAVESGAVIQTKGVGATGSFKLDPNKPKKKIEKKTTNPKKPRAKKDDNTNDKKPIKEGIKIKPVKGSDSKEKSTKPKEKMAKFSKDTRSPVKKKLPPKARRKSLGSIVKAPKMNPKTPTKSKTIIKKQKP